MQRSLPLFLLLIACSKDPAAATAPTATASSAAPAASVATTASAPAPSASSATGVFSPAKVTSLTDFLPPTLDGTALRSFGNDPDMGPPKGGAAGAYLNAASRKSININLFPVLDLKSSRAQFHGLEPGQTREAPAAKLSFKAFDVNGYTVERTLFQSGAKKSEAKILLADKVDVRVSVQPTDDPDESIALIRRLDLAGIEAFAKKM